MPEQEPVREGSETMTMDPTPAQEAQEDIAPETLEGLRELAAALRDLHDKAYAAYREPVEDICSRSASSVEVEHLLDHMLSFAGDERVLLLFKRVCRRYLCRYPTLIRDYVYLWKDMYEEDDPKDDAPQDDAPVDDDETPLQPHSSACRRVPQRLFDRA